MLKAVRCHAPLHAVGGIAVEVANWQRLPASGRVSAVYGLYKNGG